MRTLPIVIVLMLVSIASAQQLPSQVDLKAAYCIPIVQHVIAGVTSVINNTPPEVYSRLSSETKELTTKQLADSDANLRKLQFYLVPRLRYLDTFALAAASKSAEEDIVRQREYVNTCEAKCQNEVRSCDAKCQNEFGSLRLARMSCVMKCASDSALGTRMQACHDLSWLPF